MARPERLQDVTVTQPFEAAVREHGPRVLRICRASLGPGPDADDAWSETFLAALAAWPTLLRDGVDVECWLVRVAQRRCVDVLRARARRPIPSDQPPDTPSPHGNPDPAATALWDAVAALPERQRLAIAGHYLAGLPHAETAELIGGTPESVRRAAADGLKSLRRLDLRDSPTEPEPPPATSRRHPRTDPARRPS